MADKLELDSVPPLCSIVAIFIGPMAMGVMIEQLLLGILCSQAFAYFRYHFSTDSIFCKSIATCLIISTMFMGIMDFMALYRVLVWDYGDCEKFDFMPWFMWMEPSVTAWIGFVAHIFYIFRCWAVTRSAYACIFFAIVALSSLAAGVIVTILCFFAGRLSNLEELAIPDAIWLILTSVCDVGIAITLVVYFWRRERVLRSTDAMISRLRRTTIQTGSLTAFAALMNVVIFSYPPIAGYACVTQYSISHLYATSVLYTLLDRRSLRDILNEGSGTFVTDFQTQSSLLSAGVISSGFSLENPIRVNVNLSRIQSSSSAAYNLHDRRPYTEQA